MKNVLLTMIAFTLCSQTAMADHARREESCTSKTHELNYMGGYAVGAPYNVKVKGADEGLETLPSDAGADLYLPIELAEAPILFKTLKEEIGSKRAYNEDGYEFEITQTRTLVQFHQVSPEANQQLGISEAQTMEFVCESESSVPNGDQ